MTRDFNTWLSHFKTSIATYDYYVDFPKVYQNIDFIKVELNILNTLIGNADIEKEFIRLVEKYPEVLKCIPLLLAVRGKEVEITDDASIGLTKSRLQPPNMPILCVNPVCLGSYSTT